MRAWDLSGQKRDISRVHVWPKDRSRHFLGTIHCVIAKVKKRPGEMNCALKYLLLFADEEGSLGALVHAQMN